MSKGLSRIDGKYQWNATVVGYRQGMRQAKLVTVFADTRIDAIRDACKFVEEIGYSKCTVDHITRHR